MTGANELRFGCRQFTKKSLSGAFVITHPYMIILRIINFSLKEVRLVTGELCQIKDQEIPYCLIFSVLG
jgi:hypothetical protein